MILSYAPYIIFLLLTCVLFALYQDLNFKKSMQIKLSKGTIVDIIFFFHDILHFGHDNIRISSAIDTLQFWLEFKFICFIIGTEKNC